MRLTHAKILSHTSQKAAEDERMYSSLQSYILEVCGGTQERFVAYMVALLPLTHVLPLTQLVTDCNAASFAPAS